ncbi:hypothetical protein [Bradyrhizobium sp. RDM4]|uniref:hypothetical protein n=1 Tax=Bradyrhizobium sp. RDM4 TaxID=3378765 RepID=UPI0038FD1440
MTKHIDASVIAGRRGAELLSLFGAGAIAEEGGERRGHTRQAVYARLQRFQKQRGRASRTSGKFFAQLLEYRPFSPAEITLNRYIEDSIASASKGTKL